MSDKDDHPLQGEKLEAFHRIVDGEVAQIRLVLQDGGGDEAAWLMRAKVLAILAFSVQELGMSLAEAREVLVDNARNM